MSTDGPAAQPIVKEESEAEEVSVEEIEIEEESVILASPVPTGDSVDGDAEVPPAETAEPVAPTAPAVAKPDIPDSAVAVAPKVTFVASRLRGRRGRRIPGQQGRHHDRERGRPRRDGFSRDRRRACDRHARDVKTEAHFDSARRARVKVFEVVDKTTGRTLYIPKRRESTSRRRASQSPLTEP